MISQKFNIIPQGLVKSGSASYNADTDSGVIDYQADLKVGVLFFTKDFPVSGVFKIDPSVLQSKNVHVGTKIELGGFSLEVQSIIANKANCVLNLAMPQASESGFGQLDLSGDFIAIDFLKTSGSIFNQTINIDAEAV